MTQFQNESLTFQGMLKNNLELVRDSWQLHGRHSEIGELSVKNTEGNRKGLQTLEIKTKVKANAQSRAQGGDSSILD